MQGYQEVETYAQLLEALNRMTPEQLRQRPQVVISSDDGAVSVECMPVLAIGEVDALEFERVRSSRDNKYHGEEVVIVVDYNPFGEDGRLGFELKPDGTEVPFYCKDGPTKASDQMRKLPY